MFDSALAKLTSVYVGILLIICLFFSINWYMIAERELERAPQKLDQILQVNSRSLRPSIIEDILDIRNIQLERSKQAVMLRIALSNAAIVVLGMAGCYWLAKRTLKPIQEAHEAQGRFTADASHELRTPLAVMRTETEVTLRDPKLNKQLAVDQLVSNLEEVKQLQGLTDNLLLLARNPAEEQVEIKNVSLKPLVDAVAERFAKQAKASKQTIRIELTAKQAKTNPELLTSVLNILVDNAIKYSTHQGVIKIVSDIHDKQYISLTISDNGIGMSPEVQIHIFERFYRADNARTKQVAAGHGLGLSIAYELVKRLRGYIRVESVPNEGSSFILLLPRS